jgi:hypothetical protein
LGHGHTVAFWFESSTTEGIRHLSRKQKVKISKAQRKQKMRRSQKTEFRIENSEYPMPQIRGNGNGKNFFGSTIKMGGFKPRFSIQSVAQNPFWILAPEF